MRDEERSAGRFSAPECGNEAMRDALPSLEHHRLSVAERLLVEAHLRDCGACVAELALLRDARRLFGEAPALDLDRLAAAVASATRSTAPVGVIPLAPRLARSAPRRAWATRFSGRTGLRAAAAALLVAVGAGGVMLGRDRVGDDVGPGRTTVAAGPTAAVLETAPGATNARLTPPLGATSGPQFAAVTPGVPHALGERFADLDDTELDAVLRAIERDDASLPALEPVVLAPEYRGGGA